MSKSPNKEISYYLISSFYIVSLFVSVLITSVQTSLASCIVSYTMNNKVINLPEGTCVKSISKPENISDSNIAEVKYIQTGSSQLESRLIDLSKFGAIYTTPGDHVPTPCTSGLNCENDVICDDRSRHQSGYVCPTPQPVCSTTQTLVSGVCMQNCTNGLSVATYPTCSCPAGQNVVGGSCVPVATPTCTSNQTLVSGVCKDGCRINDITIPHGGQVTRYELAISPTCTPQIRVCDNGVLSGSYTSTVCEVRNSVSGSSILGTTGTNPRGIAIDTAGNIYTINEQSKNITKITPAGVSSIFATGVKSWGITTDPQGNVYTLNSDSEAKYDAQIGSYYTNIDSNNVTKFSPSGTQLTTYSLSGGIGLNAGAGSSAMVLDPSTSNIYTLNYGTHDVTKITPAGVSGIIGTSVAIGSAITMDRGGNLYIIGYNRITKITPEGLKTDISISGLADPNGLVIDSLGNLYTIQNSNIIKITPAGVKSTFSDAGGSSNIPQNYSISLTIDSSDNLYVAKTNSVVKITPAGVVSVLGATSGHPIDIIVDSATGNIYTANYYGNNVTKIVP